MAAPSSEQVRKASSGRRPLRQSAFAGRRRKLWIALELGPQGMAGCRVRREADGRARVEAVKRAAWSGPVSQDLSGKADEVAEFVRSLKDTETKAAGCVSLHPSWMLVRKVPVPPASAKAVRAFLALQVERIQSTLSAGELAWDSLAVASGKPSAAKQALLTLCRKATIESVAEAFGLAGAPLAFATPAWVGGVRCLAESGAFPAEGECTLVCCDGEGASIVRTAGGAIADCSWVPGGPAGSPAPYGMLPFALQGAMASGETPVLLCGEKSARSAARAALANPADVAEYSGASLPSLIVLAPDAEPEAAALSPALVGLALEAVRPPRPRFSFLPATGGSAAFAGLASALSTPWKAGAIAAAMLALALLVGFSTRALEIRLLTNAAAKSAAVAAKVEAASANVAILRRMQKEKLPVLDILQNLSESMPPGVQVGVRIDKTGKVTINGRAPSYTLAEDLTAKLNGARFFERAATEQMGMPQPGQVSFVTHCRIKKGVTAEVTK